jgi:hypothetical protein
MPNNDPIDFNDPSNPSYYCNGSVQATNTNQGLTVQGDMSINGTITIAYADPHQYSDLAQNIQWIQAAHQKLGYPPYQHQTSDAMGPMNFCHQLVNTQMLMQTLRQLGPAEWLDPSWPF